MATGRLKHGGPPPGVKLGEIHNGRVWVLHPTKGYRSRGEMRVTVDKKDPSPFNRLKLMFLQAARSRGIIQ